MRSFEMTETFALSSVKPLEELASYRKALIELTKKALAHGSQPRALSPISQRVLEPAGEVEGLPYGRCPESGSLFLTQLPKPQVWAELLTQVVQLRHSPVGFHRNLAQSRMDHVYAPKLEWMEEALRLQQIRQPRVLEVATAPSDFTQLLRESATFSQVVTEDETALAFSKDPDGRQPLEAAILLESLDHSMEPAGLAQALSQRLVPGGLLFVTCLVASGFDFHVLGLRNLYLVPPDRANCFTLKGLTQLLKRHRFELVEVSTPGVLDVEIVRSHWQKDPTLPVSSFERFILESDEEARRAFQSFLQEGHASSFARLVARRVS